MKTKTALFLLPLLMIFSCTSLQDVNIVQNGMSGELLEVHASFAAADAAFAQGKTDGTDTESLLALIDGELSDVSLMKAAAARLYALKGCVLLRLGRKGEAKQLYDLSLASSKGDVYSIVLLHRLNKVKGSKADGGDESIEKSLVSESDKAVLVLEEALDYYEAKDYVTAVSRFDEAFLSLSDFYKEGYGKLRDEGWNLRNVKPASSSASDVTSLLPLEKITVSQMIFLTDKSTSLLYNLTGGRAFSENDLFNKVKEAFLLEPAVSSAAAFSVTAETQADRTVCARFIWNLFNRNKPADNKTRYSSRYSKIKMRSPVPDVPVSAPDFDAVLGCVENEFFHLDDGIYFKGEKPVSALDFMEAVKKLEK